MSAHPAATPGAGEAGEAVISVRAPAGGIDYSDSLDHFENGLLRLMNLGRGEFDRWLALAESSEAPELLERLREGWAQLRPPPRGLAAAGGNDGLGEGSAGGPPVAVAGSASVGEGSAWPVGAGPGGRVGRVWHAAIAETPSHGVALSEDGPRHGWLVRWDGRQFARETAPPPYEEEYFEGDKLQAGGYGDYTAQASWRGEKAARQVHELRARTGLQGGRVLDIGSGYGYFRVALGEAGYEHEGLEVSDHARAVAQRSYGLSTHGGTLEQHWEAWESRYDAVTLFDLIEHLADPDLFLARAAQILRPGGLLGVKTPNIDCPEARVFGPHYHSLKREHLAFFSADSLTAAARGAGLQPVDVATASHLLVGFVGATQTRRWERELQGADLVAWYRKTS